MEIYKKIIEKYNFKFSETSSGCSMQTGIGDILIYALQIKNNITKKIFFVNINIFLLNPYKYSDVINIFEFKIKLLNKLKLHDNILFMNDSNVLYSNQQNYNNQIKHFNVLNKYFVFTHIPVNNEYIIFHTKCRFYPGMKYEILKNKLKSFFETFETRFVIVILGEKNIGDHYPSSFGITTIYEELKILQKKNNVIDLSQETILDKLDFYSFEKDLSIINNAKMNICFGNGGHLVSSLIFGKITLAYTSKLDQSGFRKQYLNDNHIDLHKDINIFLDELTKRL